MGIDISFFEQPIPVPIKLIKNTVNDDSTVSQEEVLLMLFLRREENAERGKYEMARLVGGKEEEARLARFCNLLDKEPDVTGFPQDERSLRERAKEYFGKPVYQGLILSVMVYYDRASTPFADYK